MARLLSLNVGLPHEVMWNSKTVRTAVWKFPVSGRRMVRKLNIDGDRRYLREMVVPDRSLPHMREWPDQRISQLSARTARHACSRQCAHLLLETTRGCCH